MERSKNTVPRSDKGIRRSSFCKWGHNKDVVGRYVGQGCRVCVRKRAKEWRINNPEQYRKLSLSAYHRKFKRNPDSYRNNTKRWRKNNPGMAALSNIKYHAERKLRVPSFGQAGIKEFYNNRPEGYEVDHIIPLKGKTASGLHVIWNLQYLPKAVNRSKFNRMPA